VTRHSKPLGALALALAIWLAAVSAGSANDWSEASFDSLMWWADAIVVGEAETAQPGRTVGDCQMSALRVRVEDVLIGALSVAAGESIVVEVPGSCDGALTLESLAPPAQAIFIVQNKGFEMRRTQPATSISMTRDERGYWRLPPGLPIPYDADGRVGVFGQSGSFLDEEAGRSFRRLVRDLRELDYTYWPPPEEKVEGVPLFWIFVGPAALLALLGGVPLMSAAIVLTRGRRWPLRLSAALVATVCMVVLVVWGTTPIARGMRTIDFAERHPQMLATVNEIRALRMPAGAWGEHQGAWYTISDGGRLMVFFYRAAGFSPDPYCGYEYASFPDLLEVDPHGSGGGVAEHLGDGWYWICAS
jgi:hypothetical protein